MLLVAPGNRWNVLAYVLAGSIILHYPLWWWCRRRALAAGPRADRAEKLQAVLPVLGNSLFLMAVVVYLGAACSWQFTCGQG
jgi:hypothetical protein